MNSLSMLRARSMISPSPCRSNSTGLIPCSRLIYRVPKAHQWFDNGSRKNKADPDAQQKRNHRDDAQDPFRIMKKATSLLDGLVEHAPSFLLPTVTRFRNTC